MEYMVNRITEDLCDVCGGAGLALDESQCSACNGVGKLELFQMTQSFGVFNAYQIVEATDISEYLGLSDTHKEHYKLLISAGIVDLNEMTNARTALLAMFGPETTTRANLIALLEE